MGIKKCQNENEDQRNTFYNGSQHKAMVLLSFRVYTISEVLNSDRVYGVV